MFPPIIISEAWPWFMLLPSQKNSRLGEWVSSYCIHGDFFHFAFPDEATCIQFKFTFPGLIPDDIWYTKLQSNNYE